MNSTRNSFKSINSMKQLNDFQIVFRKKNKDFSRYKLHKIIQIFHRSSLIQPVLEMTKYREIELLKLKSKYKK